MYRRCGFRYEKETARRRCLRHIAGIDEAGRGALAGPVVAAAVDPSGKISTPEVEGFETARRRNCAKKSIRS